MNRRERAIDAFNHSTLKHPVPGFPKSVNVIRKMIVSRYIAGWNNHQSKEGTRFTVRKHSSSFKAKLPTAYSFSPTFVHRLISLVKTPFVTLRNKIETSMKRRKAIKAITSRKGEALYAQLEKIISNLSE